MALIGSITTNDISGSASGISGSILGISGSLDVVYDGSSNEDGWVQLQEMSAGAPGNPAANKGKIYCLDDSGTTTLYFKDSSGTQTDLLAGGGGGGGNTLNAAYDQGGAGAGAIVTVDGQPVQMAVAGASSTAMVVTGAVAFGSASVEYSGHLPPMPDTNTGFFISGSIAHSGSVESDGMVQPTGRGKTVFGGDVVVSGSFPRTCVLHYAARVNGDVGTNSQAYWYRPSYQYGTFYYLWTLQEITTGISENDFDAPPPTVFSHAVEYHGHTFAPFDATVTGYSWTAAAYAAANDDPQGIKYIAALTHCRGPVTGAYAVGEIPTLHQIGSNSIMQAQTDYTQTAMQMTSSLDYKVNKGDLIIPWTRRPYYDEGGATIGTGAELYVFTAAVVLEERFDGPVPIK